LDVKKSQQIFISNHRDCPPNHVSKFQLVYPVTTQAEAHESWYQQAAESSSCPRPELSFERGPPYLSRQTSLRTVPSRTLKTPTHQGMCNTPPSWTTSLIINQPLKTNFRQHQSREVTFVPPTTWGGGVRYCFLKCRESIKIV
jgi:hypothetical protein